MKCIQHKLAVLYDCQSVLKVDKRAPMQWNVLHIRKTADVYVFLLKSREEMLCVTSASAFAVQLPVTVMTVSVQFPAYISN